MSQSLWDSSYFAALWLLSVSVANFIRRLVWFQWAMDLLILLNEFISTQIQLLSTTKKQHTIKLYQADFDCNENQYYSYFTWSLFALYGTNSSCVFSRIFY